MDGATIYRIALGEDRHPDAWQLALAGDAWPRVLIAPTGSGKTAAVTLGWATRRLHSPDDTPRRLVWCLPMRTLVEQTARAVVEWLRKLATDEVDGEGRLPRPADVHVLMGGVDADGWLERPERPAVLVGTQDMLLSRTLMQAVEAGVDISAAVLFTELAPWSSLVQRFGRANRYAELPDGEDVHWIDLLRPAGATASDKDTEELARPYETAELQAARNRLTGLTDVAPVHLPPPGDVDPPRRVIRRKNLDDLFDTDPDLTGFDVDVSPYVRDADDTDLRVLWCEHPSAPHRPWSRVGRGRRARSSQLVRKHRCDEASGGPPPCELLTERHGNSHAGTRWNAIAP